MRTRSGKLLFLLTLAVSCLTVTGSRAQTQVAQYYTPQGPDYQEERQYRREERERRREEQEREREERHEEWRRHNQRYFGGMAIQPYPNEDSEEYARRVQAQCNVVWDQCARRCNTIGDAYRRQACVANCNNELYECRARF